MTQLSVYQRFPILCFIKLQPFFISVDNFVNVLWFYLLRINFIDYNAFWFARICRTDLIYISVCDDPFWFALVQITNVQSRNLLRANYFGSYRINMQIKVIISHHTRRAVLLDKRHVSGFMFGPLPQITRFKQLVKLLDNLWKILHTDISNDTPWFFFSFDVTTILRPREVINPIPDFAK